MDFQSKDDQKELMLDTAQYLFSVRGFEGVSLRDIALESGIANSLVSYYFKGRSHLVSLVCLRYAEAIRDERLRLLKKADESPSLDSYLTAYLMYALMMCRSSCFGGINYARLMFRMRQEKKDISKEVIEHYVLPVSMKYYDKIHQLLGTRKKKDIIWMNHMMDSMFYSLLGKYTQELPDIDFVMSDLPEKFLQEGVQIMKSMLLFSSPIKV